MYRICVKTFFLLGFAIIFSACSITARNEQLELRKFKNNELDDGVWVKDNRINDTKFLKDLIKYRKWPEIDYIIRHPNNRYDLKNDSQHLCLFANAITSYPLPKTFLLYLIENGVDYYNYIKTGEVHVACHERLMEFVAKTDNLDGFIFLLELGFKTKLKTDGNDAYNWSLETEQKKIAKYMEENGLRPKKLLPISNYQQTNRGIFRYDFGNLVYIDSCTSLKKDLPSNNLVALSKYGL